MLHSCPVVNQGVVYVQHKNVPSSSCSSCCPCCPLWQRSEAMHLDRGVAGHPLLNEGRHGGLLVEGQATLLSITAFLIIPPKVILHFSPCCYSCCLQLLHFLQGCGCSAHHHQLVQGLLQSQAAEGHSCTAGLGQPNQLQCVPLHLKDGQDAVLQVCDCEIVLQLQHFLLAAEG